MAKTRSADEAPDVSKGTVEARGHTPDAAPARGVKFRTPTLVNCVKCQSSEEFSAISESYEAGWRIIKNGVGLGWACPEHAQENWTDAVYPMEECAQRIPKMWEAGAIETGMPNATT